MASLLLAGHTALCLQQ